MGIIIAEILECVSLSSFQKDKVISIRESPEKSFLKLLI